MHGVNVPAMTLCDNGKPHEGHPYTVGFWVGACWGRPELNTPAHAAWEMIYEAISEHLHGDQSGLEEGVAAAVTRLTETNRLHPGWWR